MQEAKTKLLNAARRLFAQRGLHATPTSAISKAGGVSTGLLFHHFSGKDKLIHELYVREKLAMLEHDIEPGNIPADLRSTVKKMVLNTLDWMLENPESLRFIMQIFPTAYRAPAEADERLSSYYAQVTDLFGRGRKADIFLDLPDKLLEEMIFYQLVAVVDYQQRHPELTIDESFKTTLFRSVWASITK